jgi:hypothetical protein
MKTDKVVKKLGAGAGAKNNISCLSFSYGIRSFPTVIPSHGINPTEFFCIVWCIPVKHATYTNLELNITILQMNEIVFKSVV